MFSESMVRKEESRSISLEMLTSLATLQNKMPENKEINHLHPSLGHSLRKLYHLYPMSSSQHIKCLYHKNVLFQ